LALFNLRGWKCLGGGGELYIHKTCPQPKPTFGLVGESGI